MAAIELQDVSAGYRGRMILDGVSLAVEPGAFHFLTGPSGAGKTTVLRLLHREIFESAGRVTILGEDSRDRDRIAALRRRIGFVHQEAAFIDHLDLRENVALPFRVDGRDHAADAAEVDQLVAWVGLKDRSAARPEELSGGEKQRAALARAVLRAPELVLADEPTGNVDWEMSLRLMDLLVELNGTGTTVIVASHDLALIRHARARVAARVLRIDGGRLIAAGADL